MTDLLINIAQVATLRKARQEAFPDPVEAAVRCEDAGADGIVCHLREDRRHIRDADVARLKEAVRGKLDFELSTEPEIVDLCCATRPELATLVPERREEITTEGGLDVIAHRGLLTDTVARLQGAGVREVALFVDPDLDQIRATLETGAQCIELHTGDFANATGADQVQRARILGRAARFANAQGLIVHAGHGLDYRNYPLFAQHVPHVAEVSIGFAVVARAILDGLQVAVQDMIRLVKHGP